MRHGQQRILLAFFAMAVAAALLCGASAIFADDSATVEKEQFADKVTPKKEQSADAANESVSDTADGEAQPAEKSQDDVVTQETENPSAVEEEKPVAEKEAEKAPVAADAKKPVADTEKTAEKKPVVDEVKKPVADETKQTAKEKPAEAKQPVKAADTRKEKDIAAAKSPVSDKKSGVTASSTNTAANGAPRVVVYANYGLFKPVSAFGTRYKQTFAPFVGVSALSINWHGIYPEAQFGYAKIKSISSSKRVDSQMSFLSLTAGAGYRIPFTMPSFMSRLDMFKREGSFFFRAADGITKVSFTSDTEKTPVVDYINTIVLGAGVMYPFAENVEAGLETGYRRVFMSGTPFQAWTVSINVGARW